MTPYQRAHLGALRMAECPAFNLVLASFTEDVQAVLEHLFREGEYTNEAFASHPVVVTYLASLVRIGHTDPNDVSRALEACRAVVRQEEVKR